MDIKRAVCCLLSVVDASMSGLSPPSSEEEAQDEGVRSPRLAAMQRDLAARLLSTMIGVYLDGRQRVRAEVGVSRLSPHR